MQPAGYAIVSGSMEYEIIVLIVMLHQVKYFKQKRVADFNKAQQMKKLEAEGAVPISTATEQSKWKFW